MGYSWPDLPTAYNNKQFEADFRSVWATYQSNLANIGIRVESYFMDYIWADSSERTAQTGMSEGDYGLQQDTNAVYQYTSGSWVFIYYQVPMNPTFTGSGSETVVTIDNTAVNGDPVLKFSLGGTVIRSIGIDDSDSDKLKIGTTDLATGTAFTLDGSGNLDILNNITLGGTIDGVDLAALYNIVGGVTAAEMDQIENIGSETISNTQWSYLGALDQHLTTLTDVVFGSVSVTAPALSDNSSKVITSAWFLQKIAELDIARFVGKISNADTNPNYPAANAGDIWVFDTVDGKIGGASGRDVEVGDSMMCIVDASASGDQATVGANWVIGQTNLNPQLYALLAGATFTGQLEISSTTSAFIPPRMTTAQKEALTPAEGWIVFDITLQELQIYQNSSWSSAGGGSGSTTVSKVSHGWTANDIGKVVVKGTGAGVFVVADADDDISANVVGYISKINSADKFGISGTGYVNQSTAIWDALCGTTGGLTEGETYYLNISTGTYLYTTDLSAFVEGNVSLPCFVAWSTTEAWFLGFRGSVLGGGNSKGTFFTAANFTSNEFSFTHGLDNKYPDVMVFDEVGTKIVGINHRYTTGNETNSQTLYFSDTALTKMGANTYYLRVVGNGESANVDISSADPVSEGITPDPGDSGDYAAGNHRHGILNYCEYSPNANIPLTSGENYIASAALVESTRKLYARVGTIVGYDSGTGYFTFPSTGEWECFYELAIGDTGTITIPYIRHGFRITDDNFSTNEAWQGDTSQEVTATAGILITKSIRLRITDITQDKMGVIIRYFDASGGYISYTSLRSRICFRKIADL